MSSKVQTESNSGAFLLLSAAVLAPIFGSCSESAAQFDTPKPLEAPLEPPVPATALVNAPTEDDAEIAKWFKENGESTGKFIAQWSEEAGKGLDTAWHTTKDGTNAFVNDTTEWASRVGDQSIVLATEMREKGNQLSSDLADKSAEFAAQAKVMASDLAQKSAELAKDLGPKAEVWLREGAKYSKDAVLVTSDQLTKWGISIEAQRKMMHVGVDLIPVAGSTVRYYEARDMYKVALEKKDEVKQQEAKQICMLALADLGIDIGAMGVADWANGVTTTLETLHLVKTAGSVSEADIEATHKLALHLLKIQKVDDVVIYLLSAKGPDALVNYLFPSESAPPVEKVATPER